MAVSIPASSLMRRLVVCWETSTQGSSIPSIPGVGNGKLQLEISKNKNVIHSIKPTHSMISIPIQKSAVSAQDVVGWRGRILKLSILKTEE